MAKTGKRSAADLAVVRPKLVHVTDCGTEDLFGSRDPRMIAVSRNEVTITVEHERQRRMPAPMLYRLEVDSGREPAGDREAPQCMPAVARFTARCRRNGLVGAPPRA